MSKNLEQDRITRIISGHPYVLTAILVLVTLVLTGMQLENNLVTVAIMILGYLAIIGYGIYLRQAKKLTTQALIVLIFALGFMLKIGYTLYSDITVRQNDLGAFEDGQYNLFHSGYILYIRDKMALPQADVTKLGQFYHPPFHHFVCAIFLKIYELFLPEGTHNYEVLQALSLLWSQFAVILLYRTVKLVGVKEEQLPLAAVLISAFPAFTIFAGSVNNDILSVMLFLAAFYFGLKWFSEGAWKDIVLSALAVGFGMMTKLSVGLIALPLGFLFIVKFIKDIKAKNGLKTFGKLATFGVICAPLGLWFHVRNYIRFGVPFGYVLRSDNIYQDVSRYTTVQRLFGFYGFPIEDYYINLGSDGKQDYNIFSILVKTALFGEENYRDDFLMSITGYFLLIVFLIVIAISVAGFIMSVITIRKRSNIWVELSLIILVASEVFSIISFSLKYPHICSTNFRYCVPILISSVVYYLRIHGIKLKGANKDLVSKIVTVIGVAFFALAILFYTILWTYVKGEVALVEANW